MKFTDSIGKDGYDILLDLIKIPSYTNTTGEILVEEYLIDYLSRIKYLQDRPNQYGIHLINNDKHGRGIVWALYKGSSNKTIVLVNHNDVVDINEYGSLKPFAHDPELLKHALGNHSLPANIQQHLNDDWIFGRGSADMKAGLAIQLSLFKHIAEHGHDNSVLLLSQCDEETISTGMRESTNLLLQLKDTYNLDYKVLLDSEPHDRDNPDIFKIYKGSVGKTMAFVYVRGKKTHIGDIYKGINPSLILSNIIQLTEVNSAFSDVEGDEISPPPSWSYARDFKENYDASIPNCAGGYISFLTYSTTPRDILDNLSRVCITSINEGIKHISKNKLIHHEEDIPKYNPKVKLYSTLYNQVLDKIGKSEIDEIISKIMVRVNNKEISMPESNFLIIESLLSKLDDNSPTVIIGLSPPYYPHVLNRDNECLSHLKDTMAEAKKICDINIALDSYFMGISDLSYSGYEGTLEDIEMIESNMPLLSDEHYYLPLREMKSLDIPVVNIGPWGIDYHKFTERVFKKDVTETTPMLILNLINNL